MSFDSNKKEYLIFTNNPVDAGKYYIILEGVFVEGGV